jgi:hypothetical protein
MIVIAVLALAVFHPGYCFPELSGRMAKSNSIESSECEEVVVPNESLKAVPS